MIGLIVTIFLASLTGSLHCAGMCGAFVILAITGGDPSSKGPASLHGAYHLGRLLTYTSLGVVAGLIGAGLDLGGSLVGVQRGAALFAGGAMIVFGLIAIARLRGVRIPKAPMPRGWARMVERLHGFAMRRRPVTRALLIGLLTTLLPCGWLYAFVIVAAGTANPLSGAVAMAAFWLGTVPILVTVGGLAGRLAGRLGRHVPVLTSMAIIGAGLFTVCQRLVIPAPEPLVATSHAAAAPDLQEQVESIDQSELPCCSLHAH
ncbi:MAG: sulfite exporter TauE/SafE family protein [Phycisphaerales bacterium]|nr:sulfite exporter TauE/SafE family protein [Phycisphaerales bacterium]